jgi:hypothetical protein
MTQAARDDLAALRKRSRAQWLFRALLEDEGNRSLSVVELCRRAGYTSTTKPWFRALNDEVFRAHLESIGVPVRRRDGKQEPPGLVPLADPDEVWRSDTVDLRRLTNEYPKHVSGANFKLVFTFIANPELRALIKRYFRARVVFWRPATFRPYLKHIKPFLTRLGAQYPDLDSFAGLTRAMIEPVLHLPYWIDQTGQQHPITAYRRAKMAGVLDGMLLTCGCMIGQKRRHVS